MKQWIFVLGTLLLISLATCAPKTQDKNVEKTLEKPSEKTYPKKVTSLKKKPTKSPITKSPLEAFKGLPEDDLDFIKELDKQFKLHGDKIKIKVERDNTTVKNSKRTVDGDLGYGYYNGQQSATGYDYPKPTFTFYPYSQQDIPASAPGYHIKDEEQSTVTIVPSFAYELKQTNSGYETNTPYAAAQQHQVEEGGHYHQQEGGQEQGHGYQHNEPVIVLKIPGPTKYASHLQVLLQQYLEIRAAQYLKILEDAEFQKHQQLQQQQQQQQEQHQQVGQLQYEEKPAEVQYQHQQEVVPQSYSYAEQHQGVNYPAIDDVYQTYKNRQLEGHPIVEQQYEEPVQYSNVQQQQGSHEAQDQPQQQYYYMPEQPAHATAIGEGYQPVYYVAMPQSEYGVPSGYASALPQGYIDDGHLPITENNPRHTHTKVLFTEPDTRDHSTQYPLPSIKPFERHAPTTAPIYPPYPPVEEHTANADYHEPQASQHYQGQASQTESVVSITQRPYNYHAHAVRGRNTKRNAAPAEESLVKLHKMINRLRPAEANGPRRTKKEVA